MSEYICNTPTCSIALSKAAFPMSMNCPVCQQVLSEIIEKPILSEEDELLISNLPYVIAYPLKRTLIEKHAWTKINLLKDTFLNFLKYLGLIAASEFFNSNLKDKKMVALFQQALAEPSFGSWNQYIRETFFYLKDNNHSFFCSDLPSYYDFIESGKKRKLFKGEIEIIDANGDIQLKKQEATAIGMLINFRNRYLGHGLTLDENDAGNHWELYFPIFRELLEQMNFTQRYPMYKFEHGETYLLNSAEISLVEKGNQESSRVWIENPQGNSMDILPFFVVPGEFSIRKEDKEQLLTYESYTGKTIKFFSPEGTEKQTSGKILEKLNLLLRDKQKETPFTPEAFTKDEFLKRIAEENKLLLDSLIAEKKIIPGIYQHREEIEINLREWIGARANIFFIAAEAGSGKTNLLAEIQKQYTDRQLPSLLIRAGRMEKTTLKEQVAYLLNIDAYEGLDKYTAIAGTQAEPTFILIDGLNEAHNTEAVWNEILNWSKIIDPGSIKFVVTSRANAKSDLERYKIQETDLNFLYGEKKDHEKGLGAVAFWLPPLDMNEMKGAWENYGVKEKSRYKPLFSFDDISYFDNSLYQEISNPLVLRLFLELYHGKKLLKGEKKYILVWEDWYNSLHSQERSLLELLATEILNSGINELLIDDLLKNECISIYLSSDLVNGPYSRLKNLGWISRYIKDVDSFLSFTVERSLIFLLSKLVEKRFNNEGQDFIIQFSQLKNKYSKDVIISFLCSKCLNGDIHLLEDLVIKLSDRSMFITPLIYYIKIHNSTFFINKFLINPTEYHWEIILQIVESLAELDYNASKSLLNGIRLLNPLNSVITLKVALNTLNILDRDDAHRYFNEIIVQKFDIENKEKNILDLVDEESFYLLGEYQKRNGAFMEAVGSLEKSLLLKINKYGEAHPDVATIYNNLGSIYLVIGENNLSIINFEKCLELRLKCFDKNHDSIANSYNAIGSFYNTINLYEKSLEFYEVSLEIRRRNLGQYHPKLAVNYNNIGTTYFNLGNMKMAKEMYEKSKEIRAKFYGLYHPEVANSIYNIAGIFSSQGKIAESIDQYEAALAIQLNAFGENNLDVASTYNNLGISYSKNSDNKKALGYYLKSLEIRKKILGENHLEVAICYINIGLSFMLHEKYKDALSNFEKSRDIHKNRFGIHGYSQRIRGTEKDVFVDIFRYIGDCYLKLNNPIEAKLNYLTAKKILNLNIFESKILECDNILSNSKDNKLTTSNSVLVVTSLLESGPIIIIPPIIKPSFIRDRFSSPTINNEKKMIPPPPVPPPIIPNAIKKPSISEEARYFLNIPNQKNGLNNNINQMKKKEKINLSHSNSDINKIIIGFSWDENKINGQSPGCDASVFMLGSDGKISDEGYFVFYNNLMSTDGSVKHNGDKRIEVGEGDDETLEITLSAVNSDIEQLVFTITINNPEAGFNFSTVQNACVKVYNAVNNSIICQYQLEESAIECDSLIIGRLYRNESEWEFESIGQAFEGGLAATVELYS